jgi:hypothetical protein
VHEPAGGDFFPSADRACSNEDHVDRPSRPQASAAQRIEHEPIETYSNGVRHVKIADPDGNAIAFAEPPDAASASPRSAGTGASS